MIHQSFAMANYAPVPLQEAWGDVVDVRQEQADEYRQMGWGSGGAGYSTGRIDDREAGKLRPIYETETDLDDLRAISRVVAESTPAGIGALLNLTNYVIGKGFSYKVQPVKGTDDKATVDEVQRIVDDFLEANRWCMVRERELFRRSVRDGEYFLGLWASEGCTKVRIIDPERIREPQQAPDHGHSWSFGIDVDADDTETVHGYHVLWDSLDGQLDYLPAEQVVHVKRNVDSGIKRGVSDFFAVNGELQAAKKLLRNMVKGGSVQAAIAYIVQHVAGTTTAQIEALRQTNATMKYTHTDSVSTKTRYVVEDRAGTRLDVGKGQEYKGSPLGNGEAANAFVGILQAGLRSIGSRWAMPEYMISGDASNANYNSSKEAGTPFVKNCETEQAGSCDDYRRVIWIVIKNACAAGRIAKRFEDVRRLVDIQVEPPAVVIRDADKETARRDILNRSGILSDKTWAAQEGLDLDMERANGAKRQMIIPPATGLPSYSPAPVQESADDRLRTASQIAWGNYP